MILYIWYFGRSDFIYLYCSATAVQVICAWWGEGGTLWHLEIAPSIYTLSTCIYHSLLCLIIQILYFGLINLNPYKTSVYMQVLMVTLSYYAYIAGHILPPILQPSSLPATASLPSVPSGSTIYSCTNCCVHCWPSANGCGRHHLCEHTIKCTPPSTGVFIHR